MLLQQSYYSDVLNYPQFPDSFGYLLIGWILYSITSAIYFFFIRFYQNLKSDLPNIKIPYPEPKEKRVFLDDLFEALIAKNLKWNSLFDYIKNVFGLLFIKSKNLRFIIYTGGLLYWMINYLMSSMDYIMPVFIYFLKYFLWFIDLNPIWQVLFYIFAVVYIIKRIKKNK